MKEKFDAIVVGAGAAGNACAYTLAKAGLKVLQLERGESPGSKNVQGAILYSDALERIIPDFRDDAPLERHLIEQRMWVLDDQSFVGSSLPASVGALLASICTRPTEARASVTSVIVDFSKFAAPETVATRFGMRSARR